MRRFFSGCCSSLQCSKLHCHGRKPVLIEQEKHVILLGKTGNGKSSLGNTLAGNTAFETGNAASSITRECNCKKFTYAKGKKSIVVVDTPGFFDTSSGNQFEENHLEIHRSLELCGNAPHAFLIVLQCDTRFTQDEKKAIDRIDEIFPGYMRYAIVIFTHIDQLNKNQTLNDYLNPNSNNRNQDLHELINTCGDRYFGVNNRKTNKRYRLKVLKDITEQIERMLQIANAEHYRSNIVETVPIPNQKSVELSQPSNSNDDDDK
ncbi:unnamed protein product [Rotaria socialis]|uniref:AIG1-type G domain-containing protein n=1 Tax=Rotaria socialis TaxID=392032 RepID=A0A820LF82_9BILA|nr:unnamed protein product [Rotaria socialis]CAF3439956.1 unnamed protein product [Rotaria socialis]CAF3779421.1 unnamed protein product [Rotaria socialis]CAF4355393.1 unnamed protein product [Rotaria socialis]CAF4567316.1 unnamed protein product [Rotaria socialis]